MTNCKEGNHIMFTYIFSLNHKVKYFKMEDVVETISYSCPRESFEVQSCWTWSKSWCLQEIKLSSAYDSIWVTNWLFSAGDSDLPNDSCFELNSGKHYSKLEDPTQLMWELILFSLCHNKNMNQCLSSCFRRGPTCLVYGCVWDVWRISICIWRVYLPYSSGILSA